LLTTADFTKHKPPTEDPTPPAEPHTPFITSKQRIQAIERKVREQVREAKRREEDKRRVRELGERQEEVRR
jgi:hypothetical protein